MQGGGETDKTAAPETLLLDIERSGGAPGLFLRLRIEESGRLELHRPPHPEREERLPPEQLAMLRSRVAGAHFNSLSSSYFTPTAAQPHGFAWRIRHQERTVSTRDGEAPRGLAQLMQTLDTIIEDVEMASLARQIRS